MLEREYIIRKKKKSAPEHSQEQFPHLGEGTR